MAVVGGILGVLVGFTVGILFTEVIFANNESRPDVIPFAFAVAGALAGAQLGLGFSARRARAHPSS